MESLGYVLVYLMLGKLPWQNLPAEENETKKQKVKEKTSQTHMSKHVLTCKHTESGQAAVAEPARRGELAPKSRRY